MKFEIDIRFLNHESPEMLALITQGKNIMTTLQELAVQVAANTTVTESAITLIGGLKAKLDAAIASNDPAELQALSDSLTAETAKLSAAVEANTPAAPVADPVAAPAA